MRLDIESLAGGGRGVARAEGKVWFVAGALPGEVVEAEPERQRAGIVEARLTGLVLTSPWREPSPCPVALVCGGCDLAHLRRESAAEVLRALAVGALRHASAELTEMVKGAAVTVSPMGWRLRARLHWDSRRGILGFYGAHSRRTVEIDDCRVVSPLLLRTLPSLGPALAAAQVRDGDLDWVEDLAATRAVAGWRGAPAELPRVEGLAGLHPLDAEGRVVAGGWGQTGVTMALPVCLWVPVGAFFQGNRHLVPRLFARVGELVRDLGGDTLVDLYGGVGFLAAAARHAGAHMVTVVEPNRTAALAAAGNLPGATIVTSTAEAYLARGPLGERSTAVLDAPRTGVSRQVAEALCRQAPRAIIMLACDVAHFGRDASRLMAGGYGLRSLELWDLFAGSHHVEVLALFAHV
jgi:tRNA/tmRNA/rRNA uracil-C5-methylase (TrmA/RlmC/RlmD family)